MTRWVAACAATYTVAISLVTACRVLAAEGDRAESVRWEDHITLLLSERIRGEFVDWFRPPDGKAPAGAQRYNFLGSRLRVGARFTVPHVRLTLEMQDTRLVDLPDDASPPASKAGNLGPGALYFFQTRDRNQGEPFLKLGNLVLSDIPRALGMTATLGRFEYKDGLETIPKDPTLAWLKRARIGQRLVGPFGYTHVSRSFDGGQLAYDNADLNVTAWGSRPTQGGFEVSANPELDVWLAGLAVTLKRLAHLPPLDARVFYLYYEDDRDAAVKADNRPLDVRKADRKDVAIHTWGAHALSTIDVGPGRLDGLLWGVVQTGDWGRLDHEAWAYAVEAGYQLPNVPGAPWLRTGFDRSSGDSNPRDGTHETFFQIIPTARVYARLPFFNLMNNEDLFAQLILKPHPHVTVRGDYHYLRLTESADLWYAGGGATSDRVFGFAGLPAGGHRALAHLVDVSIAVSLLKHLKAYAYFGRAFGQSVVRSTFAGDTANYGYLELTYQY
ncbi:MAG: alginate export family protein [Candidatus Binatia bacterium]